MSRSRHLATHTALIVFAALTLVPFAFMVNNIFRTNQEFDHNFFAAPDAFKGILRATGPEEMSHYLEQAGRGPKLAWRVLRPFMLNSLLVSTVTALGVCLVGSSTAYVLSRYRFAGSKILLLGFLATMMFPGVLTLVPSFLLVKKLGLLNTYWAMILPYIAGGQAFSIFVFKSFFDGLPEELFESARMDGAGHLRLYWNIVLPLSMPVFSVVIIMNILATWNNFLWPFITNTDGSHHVIASGLFTMARSPHASNFSTMFAAYAISSIPLLVLFVYATKPFIRGITGGAFKA